MDLQSASVYRQVIKSGPLLGCSESHERAQTWTQTRTHYILHEEYLIERTGLIRKKSTRIHQLQHTRTHAPTSLHYKKAKERHQTIAPVSFLHKSLSLVSIQLSGVHVCPLCRLGSLVSNIKRLLFIVFWGFFNGPSRFLPDAVHPWSEHRGMAFEKQRENGPQGGDADGECEGDEGIQNQEEESGEVMP